MLENMALEWLRHITKGDLLKKVVPLKLLHIRLLEK